jgi:hypothetical protein
MRWLGGSPNTTAKVTDRPVGRHQPATRCGSLAAPRRAPRAQPSPAHHPPTSRPAPRRRCPASAADADRRAPGDRHHRRTRRRSARIARHRLRQPDTPAHAICRAAGAGQSTGTRQPLELDALSSLARSQEAREFLGIKPHAAAVDAPVQLVAMRERRHRAAADRAGTRGKLRHQWIALTIRGQAGIGRAAA